VVDELVDLSLPGVIPLVWKRLYSSSRRSDTTATLGAGWAHAFEQQVFEEERMITLREAEGRLVWFAKVRPGESTFHRRERMTLTREADGTSYRVVNHKTRLTMVFAAADASSPARLRAIRDPWENAIVLEYEGARLSRVVDTAGREVQVSWKSGRITRLEVRANGQLQQWVDYGYSSSGCLTSVADALGGTEEYEYDRHNRMVMAGLKSGVQFHYEYEANTGRCKKTWGPRGLYAVELTVDKVSKTTVVDGEEPKIITWNDQGLSTRISLPDGTVREDLAYDDDGLLVAKVNGAGEGEQYWYDERGNRVRVVDAMGSATTWEYDDRDRPTRRVTPDGLVTRYVHDSRGELTTIAFPSGESYAVSYDERGRIAEIRDGLGLIRAFEYDSRHNVAAETDGRGARTTYAYDEMGRAVTRTDALGRTARVTYDRLGRSIALRVADGSSLSRSYDASGKVARETDALGRVTTMEYAGMGVITRLTGPDGGTWELKYTSQERLQQLKNPLGETYSFVHDDAGRTIEEKTFDGRKIAYTWSDAGRVSRITHADGGWRALAYDRAGRLVGEQGSDGSAIAYHRDRLGRVTGTVLQEGDRRITTAFERDEFGRVIVERQGDRTIRHAHDQRGRRIERVLPGGATTRYAFAADDLLVGVDHDGYQLTIDRDVLGRQMQQLAAGGQVAIRSEYDAADRLIAQRAVSASPESGVPAVLAQRQWQYDRSGKVTRVDDGRWGSTTYHYDRGGQLLEAKRGAHREAFTYDPASSLIGAIEDKVGAASAWKVDPGNLLKQTDRAKYAYDARGRRIGKRSLEQGSSSADPITRYTWDCWDRLREVTFPDGARVVSTYDALGRRTRRESFAAGAASARVVEFLWDGDALAAELDASAGVRCFVHQPGTLLPLLQQERGEVFVYVNDHVGRPKELIDSAGVVAWAGRHSAWGSVVESFTEASRGARGRAVTTPFGAPGQVIDEETGLCWTKFRCFDPEVGRWLSPDPLGIEGGRNLFGFDGDPINSVDPLGLATSPTITDDELRDKTPAEIRQMAKDKGLVAVGTKDSKWKDPVTGKERLLLHEGHLDKVTGLPYDDKEAAVPHVHGFDKDGNPIRNPLVKDPNDETKGNKHFPTK
jgi:RHS repeat-associated protein